MSSASIDSPPLNLIHGLRLFPWVTQHRAELLDKSALYADTFYDCNKCIYGKDERASFRCGWIPESERTGRALVPPDYPHEDPPICAGYLTSLPQVIEAARACSWRREGALGQFYEGRLSGLVKYAIDIMASEFKAVEQHRIRKARED